MIGPRNKLGLGFALLALVLASAYAAYAATGDKTPPAQSRDTGARDTGARDTGARDTGARDIGDWRMNCPAGAKCFLSQRWAFDAGEGKEKVFGLATVVHIEQAKDKTVTMVRLVTPLGSALIPGIVFKIDAGKETKVPYMACQPGGCMTDLIFEKDMLDKLKGGKAMLVMYQGLNGQNKTAKVSLKDLPKALGALEAADQKVSGK